MSNLTVRSWKKHGKDRLYVNLPDGTAVAWADRATKTVTIKVRKHQDEALALLRRHLGDGLTVGPTSSPPREPGFTAPSRQSGQPWHPAPKHRSERPAALPPLSPSEDLARNRPGSRVVAMIAERGPSAVQRLKAKVLRQSSEWDSWYAGLEGERRVGRELERLSAFGWRVLHGIEKSNGGDIDHLLIGPGGVFSVNTKNHKGASVWVGDSMAKVNGGKPRPYAAASQAEADVVRGVLGRYCTFDVPVEPVLVFVGVTSLHRAATQYTVRIYQEREVAALGPLTGKLTPEQVERVYTVARHRRVWLRA
ncbi:MULTISPECIES: nuclease-related domain-containing protein [unclassified Streptomyces]|uniref:nuclease-related domain-containing protein n=1 Tax=unclassified Streptomyces TaxID=2593676 RepID=UPI002E37B43A|nr:MULTISPECIES: nuclease-related domain-containing protein [unclassified Streptomyces]WUC65736.1 NERD domain-containing protein [Streptomyces sp. NBC_00539]